MHHYTIASVSREDVASILPRYASRAFDLTDADMSHLASKLADDYMTQMFWPSLKILAKDIIESQTNR